MRTGYVFFRTLVGAVEDMGVKGLWKILEPSGRRVSLESLNGFVLAVGKNGLITSNNLEKMEHMFKSTIQLMLFS